MPSESPLVFSEEWGRRIAAAINASPQYRQAAADWHDTLALEMVDAPADRPRAAVLELRNGTCHAVHADGAATPAAASFCLRATSADWQEVLAGRLEPIWGIMSGRLEMAHGSIAALLPFAQAARLLVAAIASVDADFPAPPGAAEGDD